MTSLGIERVLQSTRPGRALWRLVVNLHRHNAASAANAMAFDAFLSFIPLLAIAGWFMNHVHQRGDTLIGALLKTAPGQVQQLADMEFVRLSESGAAAVPPISLVAFMWVTSSGISTAIGEFEVIFAAPPRGYWDRRLLAATCVVTTLIAFAGVTVLTLFLARWTGTTGGRIGAIALPTLVTGGAVAAFFRIAVRRPRGVRRRWLPGTLVTILLWSALSVLFSLYVRTLSRFATLYGGLATVAILLFWLWLLSLSLLVGGEVNAQLEGVRDGDEEIDAPPDES